MSKDIFYRVTTVNLIPTEVVTDFDSPEQARTWVAFNENAQIQKRSNPVIPFFITEYRYDVARRVWLSQDGLIPGLKAKKWYRIVKGECPYDDETSYVEDSEGGGDPSD